MNFSFKNNLMLTNVMVRSLLLITLLLGPLNVSASEISLTVNSKEEASPFDKIEEGVKVFEGSYKEALNRAKKENKLLFIDCYTTWCGPCNAMTVRVFPTKEVGDFMNPLFVFMKIDMEKGEGIDLKEHFNIEAFPTYVIVDGEGREQFRFTGYMPSDAFIARVSSYIDETRNFNSLYDRYEAGNRERSLVKNYMSLLYSLGEGEDAMKVAYEYMESLTEKELFEESNWIYWTNYRYYRPIENLTFMVENRDKFEVGDKVVEEFFYSLALKAYSDIVFDPSDRNGVKFSASEILNRIEEADKFVKLLNCNENEIVNLHRRASIVKTDGDLDGLIDYYVNTMFDRMSRSESNLFILQMAFTFNQTISEEGKKALFDLIDDDGQVTAIVKDRFNI